MPISQDELKQAAQRSQDKIVTNDGVDPSQSSGNADFKAELSAMKGEDKANTFKAPETDQQQAKQEYNITNKQIFGDDNTEGKVPELTQQFIVQKSNIDKMVEFGQIAQEVYTTKKICRAQILALESIARELLPATEEEVANNERKVIVSDHEVNMFTEDKSAIEVDTAINGAHASTDRITSEIRNSAIKLAEQIIENDNATKVERQEKLSKSISVFNTAIIKFLQDTNSSSLENVQLKFTRDLDWGNLCGITIGSLNYRMQDPKNIENSPLNPKNFNSTYAGVFIKSLNELFSRSTIAFNVIKNFMFGTPNIVTNSLYLQNLDDDNETKFNISNNFNVGGLFRAFGSSRFNDFYTFYLNQYNEIIDEVKKLKEALNGETSVESLIKYSSSLNNLNSTLLDIESNIAVLNAIQYALIQMLVQF